MFSVLKIRLSFATIKSGSVICWGSMLKSNIENTGEFWKKKRFCLLPKFTLIHLTYFFLSAVFLMWSLCLWYLILFCFFFVLIVLKAVWNTSWFCYVIRILTCPFAVWKHFPYYLQAASFSELVIWGQNVLSFLDWQAVPVTGFINTSHTDGNDLQTLKGGLHAVEMPSTCHNETCRCPTMTELWVDW